MIIELNRGTILTILTGLNLASNYSRTVDNASPYTPFAFHKAAEDLLTGLTKEQFKELFIMCDCKTK